MGPDFDQLAAPEPVSHADEEESELAPDGELLIDDRRIPDEQEEGLQANGEARHRRGSSVLQ